MTYLLGDKRISLDKDEFDQVESKLIIAHLKLFKYCLGNASYKFMRSLKQIIHFYGDVLTIYSTLLRKIPDYDDITLMTNRNKLGLLKLEEDFDRMLGKNDQGGRWQKNEWEKRNYESDTKRMCILAVESAQEAFDAIGKNLNCIDVFFNSFDNLKKLFIPFLLGQNKSIQLLLTKALYFFRLTTIVDEVAYIKDLTPTVLKQLRKVEKITTGIEKELAFLDTFFSAFDPSLLLYTKILLGKVILKRNIDSSQCEIIRRRKVCFQAADLVISIPLSGKLLPSFETNLLSRYLLLVALVLFFLLCFIFYRLANILSEPVSTAYEVP